MRKNIFLALAFVLLFAGCCSQPVPAPTPTPSPTPAPTPTPSPSPTFEPRVLQAEWLEVDDEHRFWVTLEETQEPSPITEDPFSGGEGRYQGLRVNFNECELVGPTPVYSFLEGYHCQPYELEFYIGDWNFDGYTDLAFYNAYAGFRYHTLAFYLWDPEAETFRQNPDGLDMLNNPTLHPEEQVITSYSSAAGGSDWYEYYRYENGVLTPVRQCSYTLEWDSWAYTAEVEDWIDGEWQTVFYSENGDEDWDEYSLWRNNINYHGT